MDTTLRVLDTWYKLHVMNYRCVDTNSMVDVRRPAIWIATKFFYFWAINPNPERGFKPGSSSECLIEFDTRSKPLGHHGQFLIAVVHILKSAFVFWLTFGVVWLHLNSKTPIYLTNLKEETFWKAACFLSFSLNYVCIKFKNFEENMHLILII